MNLRAVYCTYCIAAKVLQVATTKTQAHKRQFQRSTYTRWPESRPWSTDPLILSIINKIINKTRNTFCGTWYLPHSHVHN